MKDHERAYPCRCAACGHAEITAVGDCPKCKKKGAMKLKYDQPGQCPKCGTKLHWQTQCAAVPPNWGCVCCGYHDWQMQKMERPDFAMMP